MKILSFISCCTLISMSVHLASAQADEYTAETDFFGKSPVVLTVSRMNKPLADSPASISVIDRQMIQNSGAREIADIFRMIPGFVVGYRYGHSPAVTYHGLGSQWQRQLQVLIDGRSVFVPSFGGIPWSNLPLLLEDIERVEVTRGPNAVTYGANAFLATINIITRHAAEDLGSKITVTQDMDNHSEARDVYFRVGDQVGDLDWRITAGREEDDGFTGEHDSKLLKKLNLRTDFLTAYNQFWTIQAGINQSTFNQGDGDVSSVFRDEMASNSYQNIKWELVQDKVNTTVQLTHTKQDVEDRFLTDRLNEEIDNEFGITLYSSLPDITIDVNFNRVSSRTDLEIFQNRILGDATTIVYGASLREDNVLSHYLFNDLDEHRVSTQRLFSSIEWKYSEKLIFDLGLMLEDTSYTEKELSSRLSIIRKFDPQHSLRLVSSSAKRNPVLFEITGYSEFVIDLPAVPGLPPSITVDAWRPNLDIQPETIHSTEIGFFSEYYDRQLSTDIKLFNYRITDQITESIQQGTDPATGLPLDYEYAHNAGKTTVNGLEASVNYSPRHKNYRLYGGLSRVNAESFDADFEQSFPGLTAFAGGHLNIDEYQQLSAALYYMDELSWMDTSRHIDAYTKLDLRYRMTLNRKYDTQLELIGYNLVDQNAEYLPRNIQEKSLLLRISSRF